MEDIIEEILRKVLNLKELNIKVDTQFTEIGFDSLSKVEMVIAIEDKFGIKIDDEEGERLTCIAEVMKMIEEKKGLCSV